MTRSSRPEDDELDGLLADALTKRGELIPTRIDEVRRAEEDGVEHEGELPPELRRLSAERPGARGARGGAAAPGETAGGARSQRVVSLDAARERRQTGVGVVGYAATFALGAAAAAALLLSIDRAPTPALGPEPAGAGRTSATASASPSATPLAIEAMQTCDEDCCGGAACAAAKGELKSCPTERTCIACSASAYAKDAFRLRIGNLMPTERVDDRALAGLDLCARVGGSPWSCEPAWLDAAARPAGRTLPFVAPAEDLATSVELELRPRGGKKVFGAWRSGIKIGPNVLCRGVGVVIKDDKDEHLGGLSLFLEDAHFVELARAADRDALLARRDRLHFADLIPSWVETRGAGDQRFALVVGPLDKATAERLGRALEAKGEHPTLGFGADFVGTPQKLPER